jgi:hypothetical protein
MKGGVANTMAMTFKKRRGEEQEGNTPKGGNNEREAARQGDLNSTTQALYQQIWQAT